MTKLRSKKLESAIKKTDKLVHRTAKQATMIRETIDALILNGTQMKASKALGIRHSTLARRLVNYPEIRQGVDIALDELKKNAIQKLRSGALSYVENIQVLANESNSDNVKLTANLELLDRSGIQKPQQSNKIQVNVLNQMKEQSKDYDI